MQLYRVRPLSDHDNVTVFNFPVNVEITARRENAEKLITKIRALHNFLKNQPEP